MSSTEQELIRLTNKPPQFATYTRTAVAFAFVFKLENLYVANDCILEWFISKSNEFLFCIFLLLSLNLKGRLEPFGQVSEYFSSLYTTT